MPVAPAKIEAYIRLTSPFQWVRSTKYWKSTDIATLALPLTSVEFWGWLPSDDVASGERFMVAVRGPLTADAADLYSVEELVPGNRDVNVYLFDS